MSEKIEAAKRHLGHFLTQSKVELALGVTYEAAYQALVKALNDKNIVG